MKKGILYGSILYTQKVSQKQYLINYIQSMKNI